MHVYNTQIQILCQYFYLFYEILKWEMLILFNYIVFVIILSIRIISSDHQVFLADEVDELLSGHQLGEILHLFSDVSIDLSFIKTLEKIWRITLI
jgi:hypothetical protein